jgi:hypothetical protein
VKAPEAPQEVRERELTGEDAAHNSGVLSALLAAGGADSDHGGRSRGGLAAVARADEAQDAVHADVAAGAHIERHAEFLQAPGARIRVESSP